MLETPHLDIKRFGPFILLLVVTGLLVGAFLGVKCSQLFLFPQPLPLAAIFGIAVAAGGFAIAILLIRSRRSLALVTVALGLCLALTVLQPGSTFKFPVQTAEPVAGIQVAPLPATLLAAWGEVRLGFSLDTPNSGGSSVNAIRLAVPAGMGSLKLALTQPETVVLRADGSPTGGDRVEVVVSGWTGGTSEEIGKLLVSPGLVKQQHWIKRKFDLPTGTAAVEVKLIEGPGANASISGTTFVAVVYSPPLAWLAERGLRLLRMLSLLLPAVALGYLALPTFRSLDWRCWLKPGAFRAWVAVVGLVLVVNLYVAWWTRSGGYIYIWDHAGYWYFALELSRALSEHGLGTALEVVANSLKREYNWLAALPPAALGSLLPDITRRAYIFLIANLYYIPACLATYWLVLTMARRSGRHLGDESAPLVFPLLVCAIGLYPVFMKVILWGQPDIGGVLPLVAVILLFEGALRRISAPVPLPTTSSNLSLDLFFLGVCLAFALLLLVLFRRWYLFSAASVMLIGFICFMATLMQGWEGRGVILMRGLVLLAGGLALLLTAIPSFLLDRIMVMANYSYASAYAPYSRDWSGEIAFLGEYLGWIPLGLTLPLLVVGLVTPGARSLKWLAFASAPLSLLLFWKVQRGLSHHHLSLLFVGLTSATAYGVWELQHRTRWPLAKGFTLAGGLLVLTIWSTGNDPKHIPGLPYAELRPPTRNDIPELSRLGQFVLNDIRGGKRRFCVLGSNYTISRDVIVGLWQVDDSPGLKSLDRFSVNLPQVDTRDGPPIMLSQCDLALVADPVQFHLAPNMQRCVSLPAEDLLSGQGVGLAFRARPEIFHLQGGVTVRAFDKVRDVTEEAMDSLLQKFDAPR